LAVKLGPPMCQTRTVTDIELPRPGGGDAERNRQLDGGCGNIDNVRRLVRLQRQQVRERGEESGPGTSSNRRRPRTGVELTGGEQ
jgi:hypothetical protein